MIIAKGNLWHVCYATDGVENCHDFVIAGTPQEAVAAVRYRTGGLHASVPITITKVAIVCGQVRESTPFTSCNELDMLNANFIFEGLPRKPGTHK